MSDVSRGFGWALNSKALGRILNDTMKTKKWKAFAQIAAQAIATILTGTFVVVLAARLNGADAATMRPGYYRDPAIYGDTIIFTAEGDLWTVSAKGGPARRLTSNPGRETGAAISPDGQTVAFSAEYEGPTEVYTMPVEGGLPQRRTWDGDAAVAGWTSDGRLLVRTRRYSELPDPQLVTIDSRGRREVVPLAEAAEASYVPDGHSLFFTRYERQSSHTKRYKGGTAESIWRYDEGSEAVPLTADWPGTSHNPMFWDGRVYFLSDRDGVMNIYSMDRDGHGLKQHTHQHGFDIESAALSNGRIVYQCGADLWLLDLKTRSRRGHQHHSGLRLRSVARSLGEETARLSHRSAHRARWQRSSIHRARRGVHATGQERTHR